MLLPLIGLILDMAIQNLVPHVMKPYKQEYHYALCFIIYKYYKYEKLRSSSYR